MSTSFYSFYFTQLQNANEALLPTVLGLSVYQRCIVFNFYMNTCNDAY